jgi:L-lactate dehydrogenase (cytochrome)
MLQRAKAARVEIMMLTVDSTTGGNRERDLRTGFSIPFRLTLAGMVQFAIKPMWGINYATHERFRLPQLDEHVDMSGRALSIGRYFTEMLDPSMNWDDVAEMVRQWNGQFCSKASCPLPMLSAPSRSAVLASSSPTMAAGSWTAHGHHSTN